MQTAKKNKGVGVARPPSPLVSADGSRVRRRRMLYYQKPELAALVDAWVIKNPVSAKADTGFLVVDYVSELSDHELIRDLLIFTNSFPTDNLPIGNLLNGKGIRMTK